MFSRSQKSGDSYEQPDFSVHLLVKHNPFTDNLRRYRDTRVVIDCTERIIFNGVQHMVFT